MVRLSRLSLSALAASALLASVNPVFAAPPRPAGPVIQAPGEVTIMSLTNGAIVEIDGKPMGTIPLDDSLVLLPGQHTLKMTKRGYTEYLDTFEITPGDSLELEVDLLPFAGIVKISTPEPGATVKIDGKVEGVTPIDKDIPAGKKVIMVSRPGFYDEVKDLEIRAGEFYELSFELRPLPKKDGPVAGGGAFYEQWWFWTIVGVAGAGAAAAAIATSGGETITPTPQFSLEVP